MWANDQKNGSGKQTNLRANQVISGTWRDNQIVEVKATGPASEGTLCDSFDRQANLHP